MRSSSPPLTPWKPPPRTNWNTVTLEEWAANHPGYGPGTWRYERAKALIAARDERVARNKKTRWIDRPAPGRSRLGYGGYRLSP